jgi:hypothetical protein
MKTLRKIDMYVIPLILAALSSIILRSFALINDFSIITMHFENKIAFGISAVIVAVAIIGFITYMFFGEKEADLIAKTGNAASFIPAGIVSTALLFMGFNNFGLAFSTTVGGPFPALAVFSGILAFLSAGSFFLSVFIEKNENHYKAIFSLSIVFFLAIYTAMLFYNTTKHPTNSPNKIIDQMAYIFSSIFFLFESRISLGRAKWRPYVSFGLIATLLTAYSSIPALINYAISGYVVSDSIIENILTLTLSVFIFSKVLQTKGLTENTESDAVASIVTMARMREEELENQRKLSRANNNKEEKDETEDASNYTFDIPYVESTVEIDPNDASIDLSKSE